MPELDPETGSLRGVQPQILDMRFEDGKSFRKTPSQEVVLRIKGGFLYYVIAVGNFRRMCRSEFFGSLGLALFEI